METSEKIKEHKYRINLKQNAKGEWYGEYTVRADDIETLVKDSLQLKVEVERLCREKTR